MPAIPLPCALLQPCSGCTVVTSKRSVFSLKSSADLITSCVMISSIGPLFSPKVRRFRAFRCVSLSGGELPHDHFMLLGPQRLRPSTAPLFLRTGSGLNLYSTFRARPVLIEVNPLFSVRSTSCSSVLICHSYVRTIPSRPRSFAAPSPHRPIGSGVCRSILNAKS